jgi:hypothetical protein
LFSLTILAVGIFGDEEILLSGVGVMRREKKKNPTQIPTGKLVVKLVGDDFGGLWICT